MARHYQPDAITLDIELPGLDGWSVLDRLKHDPPPGTSRCTSSRCRRRRIAGCASAPSRYLTKPVEREALDDAFATIAGFIDRKVKTLLVVEDNDVERQSIVELIGNGDVKTTAVATGGEALKLLESEDVRLPRARSRPCRTCAASSCSRR